MIRRDINPNRAVRDFIKDHNLIPDPLVKNEVVAVYWIRKTFVAVQEDLRSKAEELQSSEEMTWGILLNMLDRIFEYAEAAIVAFVSGSGSSSEVISRTAVDLSVNLQYILIRDRDTRLSTYFHSYVQKEQKEIRQWINATSLLSEEAKKIHHKAALEKQSAMNILANLIGQTGLPIINDAKWPSVFDRFKDIGYEDSYRTVYAALSSQIHSDAEDTLNYLFGKASGDEALFSKMALETINFSRFLMYFAVVFYMRAAFAYARTFELVQAQEIISEGLKQVEDLQARIGVNKYDYIKVR